MVTLFSNILVKKRTDGVYIFKTNHAVIKRFSLHVVYVIA